MEIRPITSDEEHARALKAIESLWHTDDDTQRDELDALATLVEAYERRCWPLPGSEPIDLLHYAITEMGHSQSELATILGSKSRASEVLRKQRALTIGMVDKISRAWGLPAELLVRPYKLTRANAAKRVASGKRSRMLQRRKSVA